MSLEWGRGKDEQRLFVGIVKSPVYVLVCWLSMLVIWRWCLSKTVRDGVDVPNAQGWFRCPGAATHPSVHTILLAPSRPAAQQLQLPSPSLRTSLKPRAQTHPPHPSLHIPSTNPTSLSPAQEPQFPPTTRLPDRPYPLEDRLQQLRREPGSVLRRGCRRCARSPWRRQSSYRFSVFERGGRNGVVDESLIFRFTLRFIRPAITLLQL